MNVEAAASGLSVSFWRPLAHSRLVSFGLFVSARLRSFSFGFVRFRSCMVSFRLVPMSHSVSYDLKNFRSLIFGLVRSVFSFH